MKYTIIVPIYNCKKYLHRCLDSILKQNYKNFELILIDDGSSDGCEEVCDNYMKCDKRIIVHHIKNSGVSNARNIGISFATGDYITFIDSDDYIEKNMLMEINKKIETYKPDILKYGYYNEVGFIKRKYHFSTKINTIIYKNDYTIKIIPNIYSSNDFSNVWNAVFKKDIVKNHKFDNKLKFAEDRKFMTECVLKSNSIYILDQFLYHYIQNPNSVMNQNYSFKNFCQMKIGRASCRERVSSPV